MLFVMGVNIAQNRIRQSIGLMTAKRVQNFGSLSIQDQIVRKN